MSQEVLIPTDEEFARRAAAIQPRLIDAIGDRVRRRRRNRLAGAGAGVLLVAGLAVSAAALAPALNPDNATAISGPGGSVFAVDCYSSLTTKATVRQFPTQAEAAPAIADPAGACSQVNALTAEQDAVYAKAAQLRDAGSKCGRIATDGHVWTWELEGTSSDIGLSDGTVPKGTPVTACDTATPVTIPDTTVTATPTAVCEVAGNWAAVYPRGSSTAAEICSQVGESVWGQ